MYIILWKYRIRPQAQAEFETAYGPRGAWVQLFGRDGAYLGTELFREIGSEDRYVTIDRWRSREAHEAFRAKYDAEYSRIDHACESLTEEERCLGAFEAHSP